MSVVRTLRVRVDWVQFPAARPRFMEKNQIIINNQLISYLSVKTAGEKCLLFLHGWRSSKEVWGEVVNKLISEQANKQVSIYAIDLPGFGASPLSNFKQRGRGLSVSDYAEVVKGFIEKLELKNIIIVGHSFGGRVGIKLASLYPDIVYKLVLVDSAGFAMNENKKSVLGFVAKIVRPIFKPAFMQGLRKKIYQTIGAEDYLATPELRLTFVNITSEDLAEDIKNIVCPTLIVWGENDEATPVSFGERMKLEIKNSELKILPNAGHYSFLDRPEEFGSILINFLNNVLFL